MKTIPSSPPLLIELVLVIYYSAEPLSKRFHLTAPAVISNLKHLEGMDIIHADDESPTGYSITDRGEFFVKMICETPLPQKQWIDPRTRKEDENSN